MAPKVRRGSRAWCACAPRRWWGLFPSDISSPCRTKGPGRREKSDPPYSCASQHPPEPHVGLPIYKESIHVMDLPFYYVAVAK